MGTKKMNVIFFLGLLFFSLVSGRDGIDKSGGTKGVGFYALIGIAACLAIGSIAGGIYYMIRNAANPKEPKPTLNNVDTFMW